MPEAASGWDEANSRHFIAVGRIYTPGRDDLAEAFLRLIPAETEESFLALELGVGAGWLSEALLERFPACRLLGLDGSPAMLEETARRLRRFAGRFELRPFRLEDSAWRASGGEKPLCVLSSLVVHHLDGEGKRDLYRALRRRLALGGALLIADLVAPRGERERRYLARAWDDEVCRQSESQTGSLAAYREFVSEGWNWYEHPDPMDSPSTIGEHLRWLEEAGFLEASVFWLRAGHALYGGYAGTS
jgi:tRNA (cmo5U34)-methyltransferase